MTKRPTPKKRRAKSSGNAQYGEYVRKQTRRLKNRTNSPFSVRAAPKDRAGKALNRITRVKA